MTTPQIEQRGRKEFYITGVEPFTVQNHDGTMETHTEWGPYSDKEELKYDFKTAKLWAKKGTP